MIFFVAHVQLQCMVHRWAGAVSVSTRIHCDDEKIKTNKFEYRKNKMFYFVECEWCVVHYLICKQRREQNSTDGCKQTHTIERETNSVRDK